ncbi:MAG: hypothetical protein ABFS14_03370 [Gemmatimonadota bacterium]
MFYRSSADRFGQWTTSVAVVLFWTLVVAVPAVAQEAASETDEAEAAAIQAAREALEGEKAGAAEADPADVESIESIVAAVYDVISGEAGAPRDWDRWMSLFIPEAQLIPSGWGPDGTHRYRVITPKEYSENAPRGFAQAGFFETELHKVTEQFSGIAHVFSTYESRRSPDDAEPFVRGINSFQLMNDGARWWVVSVYWQSATAEHPIPDSYKP